LLLRSVLPTLHISVQGINSGWDNTVCMVFLAHLPIELTDIVAYEQAEGNRVVERRVAIPTYSVLSVRASSSISFK
jgi:hypothetical protein